MRRMYFLGVIGLTCAAAALTIACGEDAPDPAGGGTPDSGPPADGGTVDATATPDGGGDAATTDAAADGGPVVSSELGTAGEVLLFNDVATADFHEDDTILRASDAPGCVAHVWSTTKPPSSAGILTIGGPVVGITGGLPAAAEMPPDATNVYLYLDPTAFIFPPDDLLEVQVSGAGTSTIAAFPVQTVRPPPAAAVTVTAPVASGSGISIEAAKPLGITWTPPASAHPDVRMNVSLAVGSNVRKTRAYCSFPISSGSGTIPASLLKELASQLGPNTLGELVLFAGGLKEYAKAGVSYVIQTRRIDAQTALTVELK